MNQLYLKIGFFKRSAMLFFILTKNQHLILSALFCALIFASCSTAKKTVVSKNRNVSPERHTTRPSNKQEAPEPEIDDEQMEFEVFESATGVVDKKAEKVISTARTFIGTPYKYGGTTRAGMDCSALLINSFSAVKLNLPRSSEAQSKVGTEVSMNELKPGDLVFFATDNKKKQITHVGLITDVRSKGNVKFIHASSSLGVVETNLFAEYYQQRFRVARRVIE
jgi:probable lipoprotein NlpC